MKPDVVISADPGGDGGLGFGPGGEAVAVDEFSFQARPERFRHRIIEALTG